MGSETEATTAFEALTREVRLTFHELRAAAETLHDDPDGLSSAHRGVLESLSGAGPRTVPELARARPVSRQHIQVLVNRLLELGLVTATVNPAHERSSLIALTPSGIKRFETMRRRERRVFGQAKFPVSEARMNEAAETLRRTREFLAAMFESKPR
jgi:DNA-binding MarR family transcriptional regulator